MDIILAEIYGALLGDGCLSGYYAKSSKRWRNEVVFTGNISEEDYFVNFIKKELESRFGFKGRINRKLKDHAIEIHFTAKAVFTYFSKIFPAGKKPESLCFPAFILSNSKLLIPCLRGLFDTDGSIYLGYNKKKINGKITYKYYNVIQLKMRAPVLIKQVKQIFSDLRFKSNKITFDGTRSIIRISDQNSVKEFISRIGFRNIRNKERLAKFDLLNFNRFQ